MSSTEWGVPDDAEQVNPDELGSVPPGSADEEGGGGDEGGGWTEGGEETSGAGWTEGGGTLGPEGDEPGRSETGGQSGGFTQG